jgi:6-phosphogluconate dehydrogenase (decarboxylating)
MQVAMVGRGRTGAQRVSHRLADGHECVGLAGGSTAVKTHVKEGAISVDAPAGGRS